ncbi:MAG: hypothetical protein K6G17_04410 [Oscillospiraceae bacterium]|nr:hypothetical protein [Oscillospiraceae bacterium]
MVNARKKKRVAPLLALVYSALVLLVGALGLKYLYHYLDAYERSLPQHVIDDFVNGLREETWLREIREASPLASNGFDSPEAKFTAYYDENWRGKPLGCYKSSALSTEDNPVYIVTVGSNRLYRVVLEKAESAGYGFSYWRIRSKELLFYDSFPGFETYSITIEVPKNDCVYVNGKLLGPSFVTDREFLYTGLKTEQSQFISPPTFVRYRVEGLYEPVSVADSYGPLVGQGEDGTLYRYNTNPDLQKEMEGTARTFFESYLRYASGHKREYYPLLSLALRGSDVYTYVKTSSDAMYWSREMTVDMEYMDFTRFIAWGPDAFTCTVSYRARLTAEGQPESVSENTYDLAFVRAADDAWYCVSLSLIEA